MSSDLEAAVDATFCAAKNDPAALRLLASIGSETILGLLPEEADAAEAAEWGVALHDLLLGAMLVGVMAAVAHQHDTTFDAVARSMADTVDEMEFAPRRGGIRVRGGDG